MNFFFFLGGGGGLFREAINERAYFRNFTILFLRFPKWETTLAVNKPA